VKWIRETGEQSLRIGPRDMLIRQVDDLLDMELYRKTSEINKSSMSGAPTSVIYNNKLIQWRYTHNDDIQLLEDSHKPGTFQPKLDTTELEFSVFDKWEVVAADQGMPGSEQPLLEPTSDAQGFKITLVQERLTPLVLQGVRRYSATHQLLGSGEQLPIEYESWSEAVQSILDITNIELTSKV